jgi:hypothetical protein
VREEEDDGGGVGWTDYHSAVILFHLWKITANLSHSLRSGNGGANLAVHASTPREPRRPLCTVIKETRQTFFHPRAGRAVKLGQQPERVSIRAHRTSSLVIVSLSWQRVA